MPGLPNSPAGTAPNTRARRCGGARDEASSQSCAAVATLRQTPDEPARSTRFAPLVGLPKHATASVRTFGQTPLPLLRRPEPGGVGPIGLAFLISTMGAAALPSRSGSLASMMFSPEGAGSFPPAPAQMLDGGGGESVESLVHVAGFHGQIDLER